MEMLITSMVHTCREHSTNKQCVEENLAPIVIHACERARECVSMSSAGLALPSLDRSSLILPSTLAIRCLRAPRPHPFLLGLFQGQTETNTALCASVLQSAPPTWLAPITPPCRPPAPRFTSTSWQRWWLESQVEILVIWFGSEPRR